MMVPNRIMRRVRRMQSDMERTFNEFFGGESSMEGMSPAQVDMYEADDEVIVKLDIPGVEKSDIDVQVSNEVLEVRAEKSMEKEEKKEGALMTERAFRGYYRQIPLPVYTKNEGVKADYKDGTLTVHIPKDEEKVKRNKVPVE